MTFLECNIYSCSYNNAKVAELSGIEEEFEWQPGRICLEKVEAYSADEDLEGNPITQVQINGEFHPINLTVEEFDQCMKLFRSALVTKEDLIKIKL